MKVVLYMWMPDGLMFCSNCVIVINHLCKSIIIVDKHLKAAVHKQNVERNKSGKRQTMKNSKVNAYAYYEVKINLFDVIYQTRETVFHRDIQTPRRESKIRRAKRSIFDKIRGV